ncbi:MAG: alternative ribosome rescue aminoacyl-tRNA hydrolase ArfB [Gammaproteobacteria bacterium]|nr:alternative ribosome rescue aminoacyl-tRNA hydrolase ArfB [Gammaproteobacteria bacterium]
MIDIAPGIAIDEDELEEQFVRASGPGGQHVNKVATAVQLRFDVMRSPSLPDDVRQRLMRIAGRRMSKDGVLVIDARRFRSRERNRADALARLIELVRTAARAPTARRPTRPSLAAKRRRLERKRRRGLLKRGRGQVGSEHD